MAFENSFAWLRLTQILELLEAAWVKGQQTDTVVMDFAKAFHRVNHMQPPL